jgi:hypothetical protein
MKVYLIKINNKKFIKLIYIIYKLLLSSLLFIFLLIFKSYNIHNNTYTNSSIYTKNKIEKIQKVTQHKNQTLKLFISSRKCLHLFPKTIYFSSKYRNYNETKNITIKNIYLNENNTSYYITYIMGPRKYYYNHYGLLNSNGLIQSSDKNYSHNLFINAFSIKNYFQYRDKVFINEFQKQYSFLNIDEYDNKDKLYENYLEMKKLFKDDYNYMPETYCYPRDQNQIYIKFNNYTLDLNNLWLIKPINQYQGSGIHFLSSLKKEIKKRKKFLITKFISKLDLIDNKKYDLRLYALITGLKPLRIYFYKKGLVRKAVSVFNISMLGIKNRYMYLTNTAVNMKNKEYIFPNKSDDVNANIWNLDTYKNYLKSKNVDFNAIFEKIKDITIKSVISFQKKLLIRNKDINERNVYTILGIDILITDNYQPILLEVNGRTSLTIYNIVDKPIKANLFADSLNIAGIHLFSREKHYKKLKRNYIEDSVNNALCELYRPRGDYELIFPLNENIEKYKKYFINNNQENILFWEKIKLIK